MTVDPFLSPPAYQTQSGIVAGNGREGPPPCLPRRNMRRFDAINDQGEQEQFSPSYQETESSSAGISSIPSCMLLGPSDFKDAVIPELLSYMSYSHEYERTPRVPLKRRSRQAGNQEDSLIFLPMTTSSLPLDPLQPTTGSNKRRRSSPSGVSLASPSTPTGGFARCA